MSTESPDITGAAAMLDELLPPVDPFAGVLDGVSDDDIAAATSETRSTEGLETAETSTEEESPVVEKPSTPDKSAAEIRKELLNTQLANLKAKQAEKAQYRAFEQRQAELKTREAELERRFQEANSLQSKVQGLSKDPLKAFKELGIDPIRAYEMITDAATKMDTPEGREEAKVAALEARIEARLADKLKKLEELEKKYEQVDTHLSARNEYESMQSQKQAEAHFLSILEKPGNEEIADFYDADEFVQIGNLLAIEMREAGHKFKGGLASVDEIFQELKNRFDEKNKRAAERRGKRAAPVTTAPVTPAQPAAPKPTTTIGNSIASATGTSGSKPVTREQRLADAAKYLTSLDKMV